MRSSARYVLSLVAVGLMAGCGYAAPYRSSESVTQQGIQIVLAGQRCYVSRNDQHWPSEMNDERLYVAVKLDVVNGSERIAVLNLDALSLVAHARPRPVVIHPIESGWVDLTPGESKTLQLVFAEEPQSDRSGRLDCRHHLSLETDKAVGAVGRSIHPTAIHFQPTR